MNGHKNSWGIRGTANTLPNCKILDLSKLKALANNKITLNQKLQVVLGRVKIIMGKKNADHWHFLLFQQCFKKLNCTGSLKVVIVCLTLSQTTNFSLFQTERVCRRQFHIWWKWQNVLQTVTKHCGKRRNCSLRAISPFPTVFSKHFSCRQVKARVC